MPMMMTPVSLRKPELTRFSPMKPEPVGMVSSFHLQLEVFAGGGDLDEIDHVGAQDGLGHAAAADQIRGNYLACAGPLQLDFRAFLAGAREDEEVRVEAAGGEGYVDVLRIGSYDGDKPLCSPDPCLEEGLVVGGIAVQEEITFFLQCFDNVGVLFHHKERERFGGEFPADQGTHPAEAADDIVVMQSFNLFFHFFPPDNALELPFEHDLGQASHDIADDADAENDETDGKEFAGVAQVVDFPETDRAEGDDRHIQGIEKFPPLDPHITGNPQRYEEP